MATIILVIGLIMTAVGYYIMTYTKSGVCGLIIAILGAITILVGAYFPNEEKTQQDISIIIDGQKYKLIKE